MKETYVLGTTIREDSDVTGFLELALYRYAWEPEPGLMVG
jgi:hypothetical protein